MKFAKKTLALTLTGAMAMSMAACGSSSGDSGAADAGDASNPTKILVWSWEYSINDDVVAAFEKEHPEIDVDVQSVGGGEETVLALSNALSAGSGAPDLVQVNYNTFPQYGLDGSLEDLTQFGIKDLMDDMSAGVTGSITSGDKVVGVPFGTGPMALFYNKEIFDKAGVSEAPKTWDEYYEAAKKIHALGPNYYITNDSVEADIMHSLLWASGGYPYQIDGENITIDFDKPEITKFIEFWQKLLDEDLVDTKTRCWTEEWFKGINDGTIASIMSGAFMPSSLTGSSADVAGKMRVATIPSWDAANPTSSEAGGSGMGIPTGTDPAKAKAAYTFAEWLFNGKGADLLMENGLYPASIKKSTEQSFLDKEFEYFGGQKINEVFAESVKTVNEGWQFLPYEPHAETLYRDIVGKAYTEGGAIESKLPEYVKTIVQYGKDQGFKVNE